MGEGVLRQLFITVSRIHQRQPKPEKWPSPRFQMFSSGNARRWENSRGECYDVGLPLMISRQPLFGMLMVLSRYSGISTGVIGVR